MRWGSPPPTGGRGGVAFNLTNPTPEDLQKELHYGTSHSFTKDLD